MKSSIKTIALIFFATMSLVQPASGQADEPSPAQAQTKAAVVINQEESCQAVMAKLDEQNKKISEDLRRIKRDIAALNQSIAEPGISEAMAGIGYILGLFGVAAFMASRRKNQTPRN